MWLLRARMAPRQQVRHVGRKSATHRTYRLGSRFLLLLPADESFENVRDQDP
jgi:hypothetical protein